MKLNKISFAIAALISAASVGAQANTLVASQDFESYANSLDTRKGWKLFYDLDFDKETLQAMLEELQANSDEDQDEALPKHIKELFVQDGQIKFDALWTRKTLKEMYKDHPEHAAQFEKSAYQALDEDGKKALFKELRELCDAKIEIGNGSAYGMDPTDHMAELDAHNNCYAGKASTVRLRTFIPTEKGAKYKLSIAYQKRDYKWEKYTESEAKAFRDLVVKIGGADIDNQESQRVNLPITDLPQDGEFKLAEIEFTAGKKFTPISLRDSGHPDTFGILISDIKVEKLPEVAVTPEPETPAETLGCDLAQAKKYWEYVNPEANVNLDEAFRSTKENALSADSSQFLSLGKGGHLTLIMRENGIKATCPIAGKKLAFKEHTADTFKDFNAYPEQGFVKVGLENCQNTELNGKSQLSLNIVSSPTEERVGVQDTEFKTHESVDYTFDETKYAGCSLKWFSIHDNTDVLDPSSSKHLAKSDGADLYNLTLD